MIEPPKRRSWTPQQRAEQARKLKERKIWLKSTGPRTARGKRISSRNSYKHGAYSFEIQTLHWYVRLAALRLKQCKAHKIMEKQKMRNELRDSNPRPYLNLLPSDVALAIIRAEKDKKRRERAENSCRNKGFPI